MSRQPTNHCTTRRILFAAIFARPHFSLVLIVVTRIEGGNFANFMLSSEAISPSVGLRHREWFAATLGNYELKSVTEIFVAGTISRNPSPVLEVLSVVQHTTAPPKLRKQCWESLRKSCGEQHDPPSPLRRTKSKVAEMGHLKRVKTTPTQKSGRENGCAAASPKDLHTEQRRN